MKDLDFVTRGVELPAKAQNLDTIFAFLFNILDLITNFLGLIDIFCGLLTLPFCPVDTA